MRSAAGPALALSCLAHLLAGAIPFLVFFPVPDFAALPALFLIRVVVPVIVGSVAMAVISIVMLRRRADPSAGVRDALRAARSCGIDLITMSLVATMLAVVAVLFLGAYGFIVLHFFYGPPIALQVLVAERLPLRASLTTTRSYLRGNWRLLLYLFSVALAIGLVIFAVLGAAFVAIRETAAPWDSLALVLSQGLVVGSLATIVAAGQVALYLQLRAGLPVATVDAPQP